MPDQLAGLLAELRTDHKNMSFLLDLLEQESDNLYDGREAFGQRAVSRQRSASYRAHPHGLLSSSERSEVVDRERREVRSGRRGLGRDEQPALRRGKRGGGGSRSWRTQDERRPES